MGAIRGSRVESMPIWQFLWNAWWREANATTRAIHLASVVLPMIAGAVLDPSVINIPLWVWPVIAAVLGAITFFVGVTKRALVLEREREPKVVISDPLQYPMPWPKAMDGEPVIHHYYVKIENTFLGSVTNCTLRDIEFENNRGHKAPVTGRFFRIRSERAASPKEHSYTRKFDLRGFGDAIEIDICSMNENEIGSPIVMYYANTPTDQQKNTINRELFPHYLTIRLTADNLLIPATKKFKIFISENGTLEMETVADGAR